jgi:hypothetical protein
MSNGKQFVIWMGEFGSPSEIGNANEYCRETLMKRVVKLLQLLKATQQSDCH